MFNPNKLPNQLESGTWGGHNFVLIHHNNEVQLYWDDGEYNAYELQSGDNPKEIAENWKTEILK